MSLYFVGLLLMAAGAACGFWLGCKVSDLREGVGDADEYKVGGTD